MANGRSGHAGIINQEFLMSFSSVKTEGIAAELAEVTYHTLYEIWSFSDGKGGSYQRLYHSITRNGEHFDTQILVGDIAQARIKQLREEIRSQVKVLGSTQTRLSVRFLDPKRSADDLPDLVYKRQTWLPYSATRHQDGYYVNYILEDSPAIRSRGRMGESKGQKFGMETLPSSECDPNDRHGLPAVPTNPYN